MKDLLIIIVLVLVHYPKAKEKVFREILDVTVVGTVEDPLPGFLAGTMSSSIFLGSEEENIVKIV